MSVVKINCRVELELLYVGYGGGVWRCSGLFEYLGNASANRATSPASNYWFKMVGDLGDAGANRAISLASNSGFKVVNVTLLVVS